ncbi:velvet factor-domain-containing protein [Spinellus fusiger]|nr:velvet factor-domain-containing protein [Spinellus fusiger]
MTMTTSALPSPTPFYHIVVRQEPKKARLCSFKEKVDRRPIDPPPILQLAFTSPTHDPTLLYNPYLFVYATLTNPEDETDLDFMNGNRTTAGQMVQSLHKLKDVDNKDGGFFVFADISVRLEGFYKLKFTLFEMKGCIVHRLSSVMSETFQVYSPKAFPGMSESTFLTRSFSDQGVRVRIRKEARGTDNGKRRYSSLDREKPASMLMDPGSRESAFEVIRSEGRPEKRLLTLHQSPFEATPSEPPVVLPPPESLLRDYRATDRMSMQNLLSDIGSESYSRTRILPSPSQTTTEHGYHEGLAPETWSRAVPTLPPLHSKDTGWLGGDTYRASDRVYPMHSP